MPERQDVTDSTASEPTDEDLVLDYASRGQHATLEVLVSRHFGRAYRVARGALGDPASAEDAAEEALIALVRAAPRFRSGGRFRPWWGQIVRNAIRKEGRRRSTR